MPPLDEEEEADGTITITASAPAPNRPLNVVHLAAELAPHAKVGGLGDVVTGLARACAARGHNVRVMLPFYQFLEERHAAGDGLLEGLKHEGDVDVPKGSTHDGRVRLGNLPASVFSARISGVDVLLLRPADGTHSPLFKGARIYGGSYNECEAYVYFCRAALQWLAYGRGLGGGGQLDVLHLHDWQMAAAAMLFWDFYHTPGALPKNSSVVFTIHNLASSGETRGDELAAFLGLDEASAATFAEVDRALDERTIGHNPSRLSLLKGGVVYSARVTTVSPTYASEILTGGEAGWLRPTFLRPDVGGKMQGILNGIDYCEWSPGSDPLLPACYTAQAPAGKRVAKAFLQRGLGLDVDPQAPLIVAVTRLVPQKGIPLIAAAVRRAIEQGAQAVVLGTGHADGDLRRMADGELRGSGRGRVALLHSEALAHQLYAAADIVLVPSIFEPCGLTQMIAARYGALPLVRRTGGLADTVADVQEAGGEGGPGRPSCALGYVFDAAGEDAIRGALDRALEDYRERPDEWEKWRAFNMAVDLSWDASSGEYISVYERLVGAGS
jgi:starch synthase